MKYKLPIDRWKKCMRPLASNWNENKNHNSISLVIIQNSKSNKFLVSGNQ